MHCTSPGRNAIICNEDGGHDEHFNGDCGHGDVNAVTATTTNLQQDQIIVMDDVLLVHSEFLGKGSEEKIYDDPCELMMSDEWASPVHIPRSRSWLCCGPGGGGGATQNQQDHYLDNIPTSRCEYSSLITAQPKSTESVTLLMVSLCLSQYIKIYIF